MKICIDAGHNCSGFDTGAVGNGLREQDVTFEISSKLKALLKKAGADVVMTREAVTDSVGKNAKDSINERVKIANTCLCDYFISIHCNAGGGTGTETLILGAGGKAEKLAKAVQKEITQKLKLADRGVKIRKDLGVLKYTNMPAVLVETAFIDNKSDADILKNKTDEIAEAVCDAILSALGRQLSNNKNNFSEAKDIINQISKLVEINDRETAIAELSAVKSKNTSLYWILYKIANR